MASIIFIVISICKFVIAKLMMPLILFIRDVPTLLVMIHDFEQSFGEKEKQTKFGQIASH